jgi:hypothetical protein
MVPYDGTYHYRTSSSDRVKRVRKRDDDITTPQTPVAKQTHATQYFRVGPRGITVVWKTVIIVAGVIVTSSGGLFAWNFGLVSEDRLERRLDDTVNQLRDSEELRYRQLKKMIDLHDTSIDQISSRITDIQTVQHKQYARDEARRLTETIKQRRQREATYDRLVELNLRRLASGREPCGNVECSN